MCVFVPEWKEALERIALELRFGKVAQGMWKDYDSVSSSMLRPEPTVALYNHAVVVKQYCLEVLW